MGKQSAIEWTDATWNPWMGCAKVSTGCKNCYMFRDQRRYGYDPTQLRRSKTTFRDPLKWEESRRVFVCSWSDFFWEKVPEDWRREAWAVMAMSSRHTFLLLTKRPQNISGMLPENWRKEPWPNVWIGVSVETQKHVSRIGMLYDFPAAIKFVSAEPLLGPLDLSEHMGFVDWIITGGESDLHSPRPCDLDWVRSIRDECESHGVWFFHKQHGGSQRINGAWGGRELDGRTWDEFPRGPDG